MELVSYFQLVAYLMPPCKRSSGISSWNAVALLAAKLLAPVPARVRKERVTLIGFLRRFCSSHVSILNLEMWLAPCGHSNDCAGCIFACSSCNRFFGVRVPPLSFALFLAVPAGGMANPTRGRILRIAVTVRASVFNSTGIRFYGSGPCPCHSE